MNQQTLLHELHLLQKTLRQAGYNARISNPTTIPAIQQAINDWVSYADKHQAWNNLFHVFAEKHYGLQGLEFVLKYEHKLQQPDGFKPFCTGIMLRTLAKEYHKGLFSDHNNWLAEWDQYTDFVMKHIDHWDFAADDIFIGLYERNKDVMDEKGTAIYTIMKKRYPQASSEFMSQSLNNPLSYTPQMKNEIATVIKAYFEKELFIGQAKHLYKQFRNIRSNNTPYRVYANRNKNRIVDNLLVSLHNVVKSHSSVLHLNPIDPPVWTKNHPQHQEYKAFRKDCLVLFTTLIQQMP